MIHKLVLVGVGLIGGSLALAVKNAGLVHTVVGVDRDPESLAAAQALGVIDAAALSAAEAVADADLVVLAVPVGGMGAVMAAIAGHLPAKAVVTDVGSTKQDVTALAAAQLGRHVARFVPAHPIAGAEKSGVTAARADLFAGKQLVLTPHPQQDPEALAQVRQLWAGIGARVVEMSPAEHDAVFAAVSHLPHLLSFALVAELAGRPNAAQLFDFAASGFRDFTRIAGSSPEMWRDIALANRQALLTELALIQARLAELSGWLAEGRAEEVRDLFERASRARQAWGVQKGYDSAGSGIRPLDEKDAT